MHFRSILPIITSNLPIITIKLPIITSNYANIISLARTEADKNKVDVILNELHPNSFQSVPDPYYGGNNGFQNVYEILDEACNKIVENFEKR